ncbi:MAG: sigma-70 family RNA polymerase sigma factor [Candidatus Omnitrophica bacterium]|jgi:RNA polymerase sigma factor (sigma-70 family)|nr:sigma-70 family RNA polymerase sigma factor [Candidatus Omnitrophota bacterium]
MNNLVFEQYTKSLSHPRYTPLKREEERELMFQVASGSAKAFERVVNSHLRFVIYYLRNFTIPNHVDVMDVIQEANEGLMEGVKKYNVDKYNVRVFSYCFFHIRASINQYLREVADIKNHINYRGFEGGYFTTTDEDQDAFINEHTAEEIVNLYLKDLTEKERFTISLLFGLTPPYEPKTLRDVATMMHTTAECIRLQKEKILDKIKINKDVF